MKLLFLLLISILECSPGFAQKATGLENLGSGINTAGNEHSPVVSADGKTLFFVRVAHPENIGGKKDKGDIWVSTLNDQGVWTPAKNLGAPINNRFTNEICGISRDGQTLYLNYTYDKKANATIKSGLSYAEKSGSGWDFPKKLEVEYFQNKSDDQSYSISADGKIMILSIQSFGTYGAEDLYVSFKLGSGRWSEPQNLGSGINTRFQEVTPFIDEDNKTLYFSSNGLGGIGSRDVFVATRLDETWKNWTKPKNLGPSVNTEGMEMYFYPSPDKAYAYLMSTQNSDGYGDINRVKFKSDAIPEPEASKEDIIVVNEPTDEVYLEATFQVPDTVIVFKEIDEPLITMEEEEKVAGVTIDGLVLCEKTKEPVRAEIQYLKLPENIVAHAQKSDKNGKFQVFLHAGSQYKVTVNAKGYLPMEDMAIIENEKVTPLKVEYVLTPLEIGTTVRLNDVLFEQGTAILLENSYPELNKIAVLMKENPNLVIELGGHTDNLGSAKLNIKLSRDRVEMVKNYLVTQGVTSSRISGKGYGGVKPIASNKNAESRKLNRRVDFTIVKN